MAIGEAMAECIAEPIEEAEVIDVIGLWEPAPVIIGVCESIGEEDIIGLDDMPAEPVDEAGCVADEEWQAERVSASTAAAPPAASRLQAGRVPRVPRVPRAPSARLVRLVRLLGMGMGVHPSFGSARTVRAEAGSG